MLSNEDILLALADQRNDVPIEIVTEFTDTTRSSVVNRRIFQAKLLPIAPPLCFFEEYSNRPGTFGMSSFFANVESKYTLVPFGNTKLPTTANPELGISYNTFCNDLPIQSYTICRDNDAVPKRVPNQSDFFKENNCNHSLWSAGHLIAHRYTPEFMQAAKAATLQLKWNFIPEPHYWNCYQRSHLERQSLGGYYGVYPVYNLRFVHGRTVVKCRSNDISLTYRPIPDGEFFIGVTPKPKTTSVFMPFVDTGTKVYNSDISSKSSGKLTDVVAKHTVNPAACPTHIKIDFGLSLKANCKKLLTEQKGNELKALAQQNLFLDGTTNSLHHSAIVQQEHAAAIEFNTPQNKMECALIFSRLLHRKKTNLYLKAIAQHTQFLLDKCEAEDSTTKIVSDRSIKEFKEAFPDESTIIDSLARLKLSYHK